MFANLIAEKGAGERGEIRGAPPPPVRLRVIRVESPEAFIRSSSEGAAMARKFISMCDARIHPAVVDGLYDSNGR